MPEKIEGVARERVSGWYSKYTLGMFILSAM
jgi:hypothetical protein